MPNRFKLFTGVAATMVVAAACGAGEGDIVTDPAQNIAENIAAADGVVIPDEVPDQGGVSPEEVVTEIMDEIEGDGVLVPKGGYLAGGFFFPLDEMTFSASSSETEPADGFEALTTVTVSDDDGEIAMWQVRGSNDGNGRYSCQLLNHNGGVSALVSEIVVNGGEAYYWDLAMTEPELRPHYAPVVGESRWLCPSQPGFFDEVPVFFTLGDIIDASEDVGADGSTVGFHATSRMDAADARLDTIEGEVVVTVDATRTAADVDVQWPPLTGTLTLLTMEDPAS